MSEKGITYRLLYWTVRALAALPFRALYALSDCIYILVYYVVGYRKKTVRRNLSSSFPEKSEQELRQIERRFYHWFCDYIFETLKMLDLNEKEMLEHMEFRGVDKMMECYAEGQSCAAILGHYCNWEWLSATTLSYEAFTGKSKDELPAVGLIYHPLNNKAFDQLFIDIRSSKHGFCVPKKDILRYLLDFRRQGRLSLMGYIADQGPKWENIHLWLPFLNHDTPVFTGAERIIRKMNNAVFYVDMQRPSRGKYICTFQLMTREPNTLDEFGVTHRFFEMLEDSIRKEPAYYLWTHKRWKRTHEEFDRRFKVENGKVIKREALTRDMNILVIRFRQMGDAILSTALLNSLHETFPEADIDFVLNDRIAPLFEGHPAISNIIGFSDHERHHTMTYLRKVWQTVHNKHYDVIIDMRSTVNTMPFALFSPSSKYRIGLRKAYTALIYNHRIEECAANECMIDYDLRLMEPLAAERPLRRDRRFTLSITDEEKQHFRQYMEQQGVDFSRPVALIGVTTRVERKTWNEPAMTWVLQQWLDTYPDVQFIFNYAPGKEEENARRIYRQLNSDKRIFIDLQARSQRELAAMACHIDFYFGNEGGARHIVHAMGKPSYVIVAPSSDKAKWLPQNGIPTEGMAVTDLLPAEQLATMTYEQQFEAIGRERVWQELQHFIEQHQICTK